MAAVLSRFEGPKAGRWAQAKLDYYMGPGVDYPSWDALQAEITGFFVPGNNADWVSEPVPPTNSDTSGDKCKGLSTTGGGDAEVLRTLASAYVLRPCDTCVLLFRRT